MSSYIPPNRYADKTHFNTTEFKSALTVDDVDSKLTTKLESPASSYIDSGTEILSNRDGNLSADVYFNKTFTSAPTVVCTCLNTSASGSHRVYITNTTSSYFSIVLSSSSSDVNWIAIGSV